MRQYEHFGPSPYGVTLAVIVRHRQWGTIGLPIWSWSSVRRQDVAKMPARHGWVFQTKLQQAADLVLRAVETRQNAGKDMWVVADGAYTKRPFVRPAMDLGVTLVGRLRKDAARRACRRARRTRCQPPLVGQAYRPPARLAGRDVCVVRHPVVKQVKTFLATHRTFGGATRVVIVKEKTGPQFFDCTDINASATEIIEAFADRRKALQAASLMKELLLPPPHSREKSAPSPNACSASPSDHPRTQKV